MMCAYIAQKYFIIPEIFYHKVTWLAFHTERISIWYICLISVALTALTFCRELHVGYLKSSVVPEVKWLSIHLSNHMVKSTTTIAFGTELRVMLTVQFQIALCIWTNVPPSVSSIQHVSLLLYIHQCHQYNMTEPFIRRHVPPSVSLIQHVSL